MVSAKNIEKSFMLCTSNQEVTMGSYYYISGNKYMFVLTQSDSLKVEEPAIQSAGNKFSTIPVDLHSSLCWTFDCNYGHLKNTGRQL